MDTQNSKRLLEGALARLKGAFAVKKKPTKAEKAEAETVLAMLAGFARLERKHTN